MIPLGILASSGAVLAGDFVRLDERVLTSNEASVTFSNLSQYASTYRHLQIRATLRSNNAGVWEEARLTFNGSSTGYYSHTIFGYESSPPISSYFDDSSHLRPYFSAVGNNAPANVFGASVIDILDAFSTSKNKVTRTFGARVPNNGENRVSLGSGLWANTNAVSSISLAPFGGSLWLQGSRLSLYGVK